ncbi:MAG: fibronectin type III domain-containing protein [Candidatus Thermoplasmatota archaeon]|nr:fibronectin type III domain-containing protein [Candidatus Thermoplasmatota archaeon]
MKVRRLLTLIILLPVFLAGNAAAVTLNASEVSTSSVTLSWTEHDGSGFDKYEVYVNDGLGWTLDRTIWDSFITEHEVTGLESSETYSFKVTTVVYNSTSIAYEPEDSNIVTVTLEGIETSFLLMTLLFVVIIVIVLLTTTSMKKAAARMEQEKTEEAEVEEESEAP